MSVAVERFSRKLKSSGGNLTDSSREPNGQVQPHCTSPRRGRKKHLKQRCSDVSRQVATDTETEQGVNENSRLETTLIPSAPTLVRSNLDSFLEHTTPTVQCQYPSKMSLREESWSGRRASDGEAFPFFILGDLWDSFDEWSAYGAGVPLILPGGETVVQYYVPYLSALQIYTRDGSDVSSIHRRLGDETDWSDADLRDTVSEGSFDTEARTDLEKTCFRLPTSINESAQGHMRWDTSTLTSEVSDEGSTDAFVCEKKDKRGQLVFEYLESSSPYGRVPLADKTSELSRQFPRLRLFRSYELCRTSWVSVAWYPIYRIPTGQTMRDLVTCFLTFHSLSVSSLTDHDSNDCGTKEDRGVVGPMEEFSAARPFPIDSKAPTIPAPFKVDDARIALPAFGLASYKLRGALWSTVGQVERRRVLSLASCATSWLRQLDVQHPDFEFFVSHGAFTNR